MRSKYPKLKARQNQLDNGNDTFFCLYTQDGELANADAYMTSRVDHEGDVEPGVRVFKTSPESMTLQLWTYGPVGRAFNRNAERRAVYTLFSSNRQNMLALAKEIERIARQLHEA